MKKNQLEIGRIINTHGIRGEVKVMPLTDDPRRFERLAWVYINDNHTLKKFYIQRVKYQKNNVIVKFKELDSINDAEPFRNCMLVIDREMAVDLPPDTYFICDLIGLQVKTDQGQELGEIIDVMSAGGNDVYVVKGSSEKEILIPAIKQVVLKVDIEQGFVIVKLLEGLMDE